jgi:CRISPR-associated protein Csd1
MLHALHEYGEQLGGEPGFKTREVRWAIQITESAELLNVIPLGDGKAGTQLAYCADMHAMNSGGKAHFLVETAQTVACHFKTGEEQAKIVSGEARHRFYREMLQSASEAVQVLTPISKLLNNSAAVEGLRSEFLSKKVKPADWVTWQVGPRDPSQAPDVQEWWRSWRRSDLACDIETKPESPEGMVCLLTGELISPLATHRPITGLAGVGGLAMGDVMVGFDKAAFQSYGLKKSSNAAMSSNAAQQYVDALNQLIRQQQDATRKNPSRRTNALMVYWFKENVPPEDDPFALLYGMATEEQQAASALAHARKVLDAIRSGKRATLGNNHYYAMTLSGASGRVMVRDWMEGPFEQLVANIESWFADLAIAHRDGSGLAPAPKFLAVGGALVRDLKDLPPSTTSTLWRAAVAHLPIPQPLLAQALDRFRSALVKDETFSHARMGLIKAYFVRKPTEGAQHMKPYLNPDHPDPAYHCGRLLAVLAKLQQSALGDVGSGVVQRFYPAASTTPGLTLGRLIGNSRNHLGKLQGGLSFWYEQQIGEVMSHLGDDIPRTLGLEEQGLFALGYYQQLTAMRAPKKNGNDNNQTGEQP